MRKRTVRKNLDALDLARKVLEANLEEEQKLDISATQAELNDCSDRLAVLQSQHRNLLEFVGNVTAQLTETVNNTMNALCQFEADRQKALEMRLRGLNGQDNGGEAGEKNSPTEGK